MSPFKKNFRTSRFFVQTLHKGCLLWYPLFNTNNGNGTYHAYFENEIISAYEIEQDGLLGTAVPPGVYLEQSTPCEPLGQSKRLLEQKVYGGRTTRNY